MRPNSYVCGFLIGVALAVAGCSGDDVGATYGAPEIESDAGPDGPLDGWWLNLAGPLGEPVPTDPEAILDGGELGLNATAGAGLRYVAGHPAKVVGVAFAGSGTGISVTDPMVAELADLGAEDPLTLEIGFRTDAHGRDGADGAGVLFEREGGWSLAVVDGELVLTMTAADGGPSGTAVLGGVSDGRWHRVIAVRDVEHARLLMTLDGASRVEVDDPTTGKSVTGSPTLSIGARADGSGGLLGDIDHVALRRRAELPFDRIPTVARSIPFRGGAEPIPGGGNYASLRIPAIVQSTDGSLVAFAEARVNATCGDFGNIDVVTKRSTDGGRTWSPLVRVTDNGSGKVGNPIPFVDAIHERLVLLSSETDVQPDDCTSPRGTIRVMVQHSEDHGVTWSKRVEVTSQVKDPTWKMGLIGPSHGIQLREGPNAGALVVHAMHRSNKGNVRGGHLLVSRDGGDTWSIADTETSSAPTVEVNEGSLAELSDGRLYVNVRSQLSDLTNAQRAAGVRGQAFVSPELKFVAAPPFARSKAFRGPIVHGTTLRWVGSERYGDLPRILFSLPAGEYGSNFSQRHDLRLYVSHDDAASFGPGIRLFGGKASYSDLVALDESRLGVVFETADDGPTYNTRVEFQTFSVQELDDPTVLGWTFEDGAVGAAVTTTGGVRPHPVNLTSEGPVQAVAGRHHSTAVRFNGSRLCASTASLAHVADLGVRDSFEVEVSFRTTAHRTGGGSAAGTLVAKTVVGTESAWWLRVEDGRVRFAVSDAAGHLDIVRSTGTVTDGEFHTVRARRDVAGRRLTLSIDGGAAATVALSTTSYVTNLDRLCIGAFAGAGTPRPFVGDIDAVALRLVK